MEGHALACCVGIFLLRTEFSDGQHCTDIPPTELVSPFCEAFQATVSIIYLDSQNIDTSGISECTCTIYANSPNLVSINISNVPMSEPGEFELIVGGEKVKLPVMVNYESPMDITIHKTKPVPVKQCIKVTAGLTVTSGTFNIDCFARRAIVLTTQAPKVLTTQATILLASQAPTVAVYAVVPAVTVFLVVSIVGVLLWRRRKHSRGRSTETPDYVNTMHLEETANPNAVSVPQYENDVNDHEHSNGNNYSCLEPQREHATNEHLYSGLEPGRDLASNTNVDCVTETEQESNRYVYDNDYLRLETQREGEPDEHPYSDLEARRDLART